MPELDRPKAPSVFASAAMRWGLVALGAIALSLLPTGLFQQDIVNVGGVPQFWQFIRASVHPDLSSELLQTTLDATLKTLAYAVCATVLSVAIGLIGGVLCSEVWWLAVVKGLRDGGMRGWGDGEMRKLGKRGEELVSPYPYTSVSLYLRIFASLRSRVSFPSAFLSARALLSTPRALHELIWGLLFLRIFGLDSLTAVLAIAIPFGAITAKVFSEILDETPRQPLTILLNSGVAAPIAFCYTLLPQACLNLLSYTFYRFECSIRSAAVLGMIGAGGLGSEIRFSLESLRYEQLWTFFYALFLLNGLVDFSSAWLRQRLGCASRLDLDVHRVRVERSDRPTHNSKRNQPLTAEKSYSAHPRPALDLSLIGLAVVLLIGFCFWYVAPNFSKLWSAQTYDLFRSLLTETVPPDFSQVLQLPVLAMQTVAMSVLAIALAAIGGMMLSFPAAHNFFLPGGLLNPTQQGNRIGAWAVLLLTRAVLLMCRAIPAPVWALVVLYVLFPGILPGAIALGLHNLGILGRLKAEVIENLDQRPLEALKAQGTPNSLVFLYGVLPLTLPRFLAYDLYRWEVCMRETVIVGLVGAGGLGYLVMEQLSSFDYRGLVPTLGCFLILTFLVDWISALARRSLR